METYQHTLGVQTCSEGQLTHASSTHTGFWRAQSLGSVALGCAQQLPAIWAKMFALLKERIHVFQAMKVSESGYRIHKAMPPSILARTRPLLTGPWRLPSSLSILPRESRTSGF